ncbi:MAG: YgiT-type zinc finger domain-containing protein [Nitrospinae bacterium]|nr:YgiT-type zinc finger domain-containing protein [Nitrospinota bacterium]
MRRPNCGGEQEKVVTDLPFKVGPASIVILKKLPVIQRRNCSEYSIEDGVMEKVDTLLKKIDRKAELEILTYAA